MTLASELFFLLLLQYATHISVLTPIYCHELFQTHLFLSKYFFGLNNPQSNGGGSVSKTGIIPTLYKAGGLAGSSALEYKFSLYKVPMFTNSCRK